MNDPKIMSRRDVELKLYPSRDKIELAEVWELLLRIDNHSDDAVWISNATTTATIPAEIRPPSESNVSSAGAQFPTVPGPGVDIVRIPPGGHYVAYWRMNENPESMKKANVWQRLQWHIFFHPGTYNAQAHVHVWTECPDARRIIAPKLQEVEQAQAGARTLLGLLKAALPQQQPSDPTASSTATDDKQISQPVLQSTPTPSPLPDIFSSKADQMETLAKSFTISTVGQVEVITRSLTVFLAAAIGGFVAFLLRELHAISSPTITASFADVLLLPMYILLSVIITLFVTRVAEARFPLTIKVMDFWGALALGIIAALVGHVLLVKWMSAFGLADLFQQNAPSPTSLPAKTP